MGKIIALLFADPAIGLETWQAGVLERVAPALLAAGAARVRINLPDGAVAAGAGLRQSPDGGYPDAVVQLWLDDAAGTAGTAVPELTALLGDTAASWHGWVVEERAPLTKPMEMAAVDGRSVGWAQIALLVRPEGQSEGDWLEAWQGRHTAVAIQTQSTFEYVQNRVLHRLTLDAPDYAAIVEECFPDAALTDALSFFDAPGDPVRFKANLARMMTSCDQFITPGSITVLPTSQYEFGRAGDSAKSRH